MTLRSSLMAIRKSWLLVLALTLLCGPAAFAASSTMTPVYEARAEQYFTINFGNTANDLAQGSTYTSNQMISFGELATSDLVLGPVMRDLGLDDTPREFARRISVSTPRDTVILRITVSASDPRRAAEIANAVADQTKTTVEQVAPSMTNGRSTVAVRTINRAKVPEFQSAPNKRLDLLLGLMVGFMTGALLAVARQGVAGRIHTRGDLEELSVPYLGGLEGPGQLSSRGPSRDQVESYRYIRAILESAGQRGTTLHIVVTSPVRVGGLTTISAQISRTIAESGGSALLCDTDLNRPSLSTALGCSHAPGLSDVLEGRASITDCRQAWGRETDGLWALGAGSPVDDPGRLLASPAFESFLRDATAEGYATVVLITAPVLETADAVTLGAHVDGAVVIVESGATRRCDTRDALGLLRSGGVIVLGAALSGGGRRPAWWRWPTLGRTPR